MSLNNQIRKLYIEHRTENKLHIKFDNRIKPI